MSHTNAPLVLNEVLKRSRRRKIMKIAALVILGVVISGLGFIAFVAYQFSTVHAL